MDQYLCLTSMYNLSYYYITKYEMNYNTFERQTTYIEPSNTDENLLLYQMKAVWLYLNSKDCNERFSTANLLKSFVKATLYLQYSLPFSRRKIVLE